MTQGEVIDSLYASLYAKAGDSKYGFARFAAPWGSKYSPEYGFRKIEFSKTLRQFATECGILSLDGSFYVFNGKMYEKASEFAVEQSFDKLMEGLGIAEVMNNQKMRREVFMGTILAYNQLRVRNDLVAFSNKVVDFSHGSTPTVHSFSPRFHVTDYHPYPYLPDAKCPLWDGFIRQVLPRKRDRDVLQMFLGLGLVQTADAFDRSQGGPRGTVELCLLLLGSGANGKSVLFNVICALFGKQHITSLDYDVLTADGDEGMRGRYPIRSAIFNWSSDSDPRKFGKKNTAMFKRIVSGEPVPIRGIRQDIQENPNCPYLIFSLNELPTITDRSHGFLRRLQFVNFDVTIPRYRQDPNLAFRIIQSDLPGVFNWVLRGAMEIKRRKFQFPETETTQKQIVRALFEFSPVKSWMTAYGLRATGNAQGEIHSPVHVSELYDSFRQFCIDNGKDTDDLPTDRSFSHQLVKDGFVRKRKAEGMCYVCYGCDEEGLSRHIYIENITEPEDYSSEDSIIKDD